MEAWLTKRKGETGMDSPIYEQKDWHGIQGHGSFESSQEAYNSLYIGDANTAKDYRKNPDKFASPRIITSYRMLIQYYGDAPSCNQA